MRLILCLTLASLPAATMADCPKPGEMPKRVIFADGSVEQDLKINDGVVEVTDIAVDGTESRFTAKYGLYFGEISGGAEMVWNWLTPKLPRAEELPVEQETFFVASVDSQGGEEAIMVRYVYVSHGPEVLTVGDCEVPVIRLGQKQEFFDGSGSIVSQIWLDPERLLVLKTERDKLDASGTVEAHRSALATGFEM